MKSSKNNKPTEKETEEEEWDLSQGMGILPDDISLTQNIGCVGGRSKKPINSAKKLTKN